eukprot:80263-Chlamydomonas_euryale.AAC.4
MPVSQLAGLSHSTRASTAYNPESVHTTSSLTEGCACSLKLRLRLSAGKVCCMPESDLQETQQWMYACVRVTGSGGSACMKGSSQSRTTDTLPAADAASVPVRTINTLPAARAANAIFRGAWRGVGLSRLCTRPFETHKPATPRRLLGQLGGSQANFVHLLIGMPTTCCTLGDATGIVFASTGHLALAERQAY